jgi:hypothetical protein
MKFAIGKASMATLCLTIAIVIPPAYSVTNELVASSESHSIEKFDSSGNWIRTFASTGPWISLGIASSPVTGDVFVATITSTILRYNKSGFPFGPKGIYWSTFSLASLVGGNPIEGLLFDSSGNLYVSTYYGTSGYQVEIFRFCGGSIVEASALTEWTTDRDHDRTWKSDGVGCFWKYLYRFFHRPQHCAVLQPHDGRPHARLCLGNPGCKHSACWAEIRS